jgi:hypothetical protein
MDLRIAGHADIHLPSMNRYPPGGLYTQPDVTSTNADDFDLDVITDHDTFFFAA